MGCLGLCCCCEKEESEEDKKRSMANSPMTRNVCCTDVIFLIIFIIFWVGMIYISVFSVMQGAAERLAFGFDSFGNTCNSNKNLRIENVSLSGQDTSGKTNVLYFEVTDPFKKVQICVKTCPDKDLKTPQDVHKFYERTGSNLCYYTQDPKKINQLDPDKFTGRGPCPDLPIYKSVSLANRCVPDIRNVTLKVVEAINNDDIGRKVLHDLFASWKEMLVLCAIALVLSLLLVVLLRYLAVCFVWCIAIFSIVASIAGTGFLWWTYAKLKGKREGQKPIDVPILDLDVSNETAFLVMSIIATVLTVILLLVILVMRKQIGLVVALFQEGSKCLAAMPTLLLQPIWTFLILIFFFTYWTIVLGFLATAGRLSTRNRGFADDVLAVDYKDTTRVRVLWWYHLIGLIWTSEFILACQQMVIAGAVVMWYFTRNKKNLNCVVGKATCRVILHHLGSVAFGSFIITLVKLPRLILMYIQKKCKGSEGQCAQFCLKCCICCLWCLEKALKFLNHNAYTIVAIEGKNFCPAAKKAFIVITSNVLRVVAINSVGDFVLFLGKIGVMATTAGIGVLWLREKEDLHFYALPVILVSMFAYLVASCVISIYEMVIDTLLLCFCEDCNINDGSEGHEYFMNKGLMEFLEKTSRQMVEKPTNEGKDAELEHLPNTQ